MNRKAAAGFGLTFALCVFAALALRAAAPQVPATTWADTPDMGSARAGAGATLLEDGRILLTGGVDGTRVTASVERYSPASDSFIDTAPMQEPRAYHTATRLTDGRVLVAGGLGADGRGLQGIETYDPAARAWTAGAPLNNPRSGHTASVLPDGFIIFAAGDNGGTPSDTIELYEPYAGIVYPVAARLSSPRSAHAAVTLSDGRILIIGGYDGARVLASVDIIDPYEGTITAGPQLGTPRAGHTATLLLDGRVFVTGGVSGTAELASAEIFDPATNTFGPADGSLASPRQRHQAILLPHNNTVLIVGGVSQGAAAQTAELFVPWQGRGGRFAPTNPPSAPRVWAAASALSVAADRKTRTGPNDGLLLLAGGAPSADATGAVARGELYGFATVNTDLADYAPNRTVTITGAGWQPFETVSLTIVESGGPHRFGPFTATADSAGRIWTDEFKTDQHDFQLAFYLTAAGAVSQAQTYFTDAQNATSTTLSCAPYPVTGLELNVPTTCTATVTDIGSPVNGPPTGTVAWTRAGGGSKGTFTGSPCTLAATGPNISTCSVTFTATDPTSGTIKAAYTSDNTANWASSSSANVTYTVIAADGAGTTTVSPTSVGAGTTANSFTFSFQAAADGTAGYVSGAQATIQIPAGWTAPQSTLPGSPGYVSVTSGTCGTKTISSISGTGPWTITLDIVCADSQTFVLSYAGGSGAVTAPTASGAYTFVTQTKNNNGTLASIGTSPTVTVNPGAATKLGFTTQPGGGAAALAWGTQPVVAIQDAYGNTVTSSSASITLAIAANPGGGTLSCTTNPRSPTSGVSTFSGCQIDKVGTGYTLTASATGLTSATSNPFDITIGAATRLAFTMQPGGGTGGTAWTTQPVVTVQDAGGNTVTSSSASITLAIGTNPGSGTLTCTTNPLGASSGAATFAGCRINRTGTGYTLIASATGLTSATSSAFTISVGAAVQLAFTTQPGGGTGGTAWGTQPVVTVQDAGGNTVTSSTASVTVAIGTNPGSGTLTGTATVSAVNGVATFSGLSIDRAGTGYTLTAASGGLTGTTSSAFNITVGAAAKVVFTTQPGGGTGGTTWAAPPVVTVQDAGGNTVTSSSASVTVAIGTNPGSGTLTGTATLTAVNGVATFSGLAIDKAGTGYTLTAASAGLTGATSSSFNITVGAAAKLAFTTSPGNSTAGAAFAAQPVVTVQDAGGNTVTSSTASVTVAIGTNPGSGTLSGTATINAVNGVATFSGLSINKAGTGYTLTGSSAGLTGATSSSFNITFAAGSQVAFTTQPGGGTGGTAWGTQPVVTVQDAFGNTVTNSTASVTLAIGTNPGSGTLTGTATVSAVNGVATFSGLSIDRVGTGYTLTAASGGLTGTTSSAFNITVGVATRVVFTTQPGGGTGGTTWAAPPVVTVQDAGGNTVTSSSASVTVAIGTNPGSGTLTGTATLTAVNGVATFSGLAIDKAGTGYTLTAASAGLTGATSSSFNITVGAAAKLAFTTSPGNSTAGAAFAAQPVVTVQDAGGNTVTSSTASVTVAIGTNPGSGTLSGTATINAVNGVATFSGLSINKAGTGYTLTGASAGLTGATSGSFNITFAAAARVVFTTQPGGGTGGTAWGTQPVVTVQDAFGNTVTNSTASVTLAIGTNPGSGTLSGAATINAVNGVATFSGLAIDKAGTGYTLTAASTGLTGATSSSFNITVGAAAKLAFTTSPGNSTAGAAFAAQPVVTVQDAGGNTVTSSTASVTMAIGTNPGGGTLSGTATINAVNGVATFSGLSINKVGTGYTLTAASSGLTGATSSTFNITFAAASQVVFTTQPGGGTGGTAWGTQPVATVQDAFGNTVTNSSASVTLAIGTNPASGTLSGTATITAVNGVATFSGLSIDRAGTGYTLTASSSGLTNATSNAFNITVGAAAKLAFTVQPGSSTGGIALPAQPVVTVQDAGGNTVASSSASVTVAIGSNPGAGTLSGTATVAAVNGVATFSGLSINKAATGYTLTAASTGLTGATSSSFNITVGPAAKLAFTTSPGNATAGAAFPTPPVVAVQDAGGNTVTSSTASVTVAIGSNPGGGTLSGTTTVAAVNGVATFSGLSINKSGTGYTLTAASSGVTGATSGTFNVTFAAASQVVFTTQPGGGTGGIAWATQPVVTVQDAFGNTVTNSTASVTLAIGTNPASGTLGGTATVNAVNGVATLSGLSIDKAAAGYTLTAASSGLTGATSSSFAITVGPAAKLAFTASPSNSTGGVAFATQPVVTVQDAGGNTVTGSTASITLAIGANPSAGTLGGTLNVSAVNGVATFSGLSIDKAGTGYTLTAASGGLTGATSSPFNITVGAAVKLGFTTQPGGGTGATAWATQPVVAVQDLGGNTVTSNGGTAITLAIGTNPAGGTLTCTANPVSSASGVAAFAGCRIDKAGTGYTLTATAAGFTSATSATFNITVGPATQLVFTTQPGGGTSGTPWPTQPVVTLLDAGGNTVTSSSASITLAIGSNPGGGTLTCTANPQAATNGVDAFAGCRITRGGVGYTLTAASAGVTAATSTTFDVNDATATTFSCAPFPTSGVELNTPTTCTATVTDTGVTFGAPAGTVTFTRAGGGSGTLSGNPCTLAPASSTTATCSVTFTPTSPTSGTLSAAYTSADAAKWADSSSTAANYTVIAQDGSGTETVSPTTVTAAATGLNFTFTFTSANDGTAGYDPGSRLTLLIPAGWTAPQSTSSGAAGYVTVSSSGPGTCHTSTALASITGTGPWTLTVDLRCIANRQFTISYANVTAPTSAAAYTFTTQTANANGTLTSLASSPVVTVNATAATKLGFSASPGNSLAGAAFGSQPVVVVQDQYGNTVSSSAASITLAIQTNPSGGTLTCTANPKAAVSGTATFAGCSINKVGSGYRLSAAATGLTGVTTGTFDITPGTATTLAFTTQPGGATVGSTFTVQPVVVTRDANGNTSTVGLPSSLTLSLTIASGTGTLLGTTALDIGTAAGNGLATFSNLEIDTAQTYTLQAAVAGGVLTSATSTAFTVARANTTTIGSNATANFGDASVVLSATVADGNAIVNEGTVTFTVKDGGGTVIGTPVTSGTVTGGNATAVFSLSGVPAARYSMFAVYNVAGVNPNFNASSAAASTLTVTTTVMRVISGAYAGNGVAGTEITLLGFVPDVIIVKSDTTQEPVMWTSTMTGGIAKPVSSGTAATTNLIQTSTVNGFKVGSDPRVNAVGTDYYWTAFGAATGGLVVGSYTGNGTGQGITGVGFQPDVVVVSGEGATTPVFRTSAMSGTVTLSNGTATATRITSLDANGFTVGSGATVNSNAVVYHYAAWTANTGKVAVGAYAGSGATRSVTGLGFGPQLSLVKSTDCAATGQQHSSALGPSTDASLPFDGSGGMATGRITALQSNGFAVGTDASVNTTGCNYGWVAFAGDAPTAVRMQSASATRSDTGTFIEWKTAYEAENLGFNVYREEGGARERITPSLLAGSGLLVGAGPAAAAQTYGWWDLKRRKGSKATYWLEDVDLNGTRTWHGPIAAADGDPAQRDDDHSQATLLSQLGREAPGAPSLPTPANGNTRVTVNTTLGWRAPGATSYEVRFGATNPPVETIGNLSQRSYAPRTLEANTTYYWQVIAYFAEGTTTSPVWSFTTTDPSRAPAEADPISELPSEVPGMDIPLEDPALALGSELTAGADDAVEARERAGSSAPASVPASGSVATFPRHERAATKAAVDSVPLRATRHAATTDAASPPEAQAPQPKSARATDTVAIAARAPLSSSEPASSDPQPVPESSAPADSMESTQPPSSATASSSPAAPASEPVRPQNLRVIAPAPGNAPPPPVPPATPKNLRVNPAPRPADVQRSLAAGAVVKLAVATDGWYRVSQSALIAAGLPADTDPDTLQLFLNGVESRIAVPRASTGEFALEFYGTGGDTPDSNERIYWVVAGRGPGLRVARVRGSGEGYTGAASFPYTVEKRDRTIYFAALLNGDAENFFGDIVTSDPVDEILNVQHLDPAGSGATVEVALQGVTEGADGQNHRVEVQVNGTSVGELVFAGREHVTRTFPVAISTLRSDDNAITLIARGDAAEVSLVDTIRLTYPHTYTADADLLRFTAEGQRRITVDGFTGGAIKVIDISDPSAVLEVMGTVTATAAGYGVTIEVPGTGTRRLVAFTDGHVLEPASVRANAASRWRDSTNAADYVILTHSDFGAAVAPLASLRTQQGHAVAVVDLEDIYDEFSFGQKRPEAVRDFLVNASTSWSRAPQYLVLVGNASTDPRNYLGTGEQDFVPTKLVATSVLETASDDWFADADGDGLPELAMVGRLPARTPEQARAIVDKIVAYDGAAAGTWARSVALVADATDPGDGDFAAVSAQLRRLIPTDYSVADIFRGQAGTAQARSSLLGAINDGQIVVNYAGHGSVSTWRDDLLTGADAAGFTNGDRLPVFVMMDCLSGFFHGLYPEESLAEALMRAPQGGAVAVWASSGFTSPGSQVPLNAGFIRELFSAPGKTLGAAVAAAKRQASDSDVRRTWVLFGDPAMRLKGVQ